MTYQDNSNIIAPLTSFIRRQLQEKNTDQLIIFAQHYFKFSDSMTLANRTVEDLYRTTLSHWNLCLERLQEQNKIHIYNPTFEEHGWQSTRTVIDIVVLDKAFILQSIMMKLHHNGLVTELVLHPVYWIQRDNQGKLVKITQTKNPHSRQESVLHIEISHQSNLTIIQLEKSLHQVLIDVGIVTQDWYACKDYLQQEKKYLTTQKNIQWQESIKFLQWLMTHHFIFLGACEYHIINKKGQRTFKKIKCTGLGILRDSLTEIDTPPSLMNEEIYQVLNTHDTPLIITKSTIKATVYRPVFMDSIGIKQYNEAGQLVGEKRFLGLYASSAYTCDLSHIPLLRNKINSLYKQAEFIASTHTERALSYILHSLPRDELFQASIQTLSTYATSILQLQDRPRIRVFVRYGICGHFASLLVFVPREKYSTASRQKIQAILLTLFKSEDLDFNIKLTEAPLVRIHFMIHCHHTMYDTQVIEQQIMDALSDWQDSFRIQLHLAYEKTEANALFIAYHQGFSIAYKEATPVHTALLDLKHFQQIEQDNCFVLGVLYSPLAAAGQKQLRFKLYSLNTPVSLSLSLPMLENMGVKVCSEQSYEVKKRKQNTSFWIHDFGLIYESVNTLDIATLKHLFQETFEQCWIGRIENDGFNALVIAAGLCWQDINILRAFYFYLRQIGIAFSQNYIEQTLIHHANISALLIQFFYQRFDERQELVRLSDTCLANIEQLIEQVSSLDQDNILRRYLNLILAAERTNFFQQTVDELGNPYFSIKFNSAKVQDIPLPIPHYEIFVYSSRMEGIHLRGGTVARGGLRWSDRREDFRTEILGLMKAQMTKNAVIVPTGAKGGFVVKKTLSKDEMQEEGIACYRILIRGLLDITDNYLLNNIVKPKQIRCYDTDDPYLVVAADKGTAKFSDTANQLAQSYNYWLGDAFASGGSTGYDHKKMGITARGAWVSVLHHFARIGQDITTHDFSVVGIGSMSGDVFGNGLLLSKKIKLIAAFNHDSIFLDPTPNVEISFIERQRLFQKTRAKWSDYNLNLISLGGGVYSRQEKVIHLSTEVKQALAIEADKLSANELIKAILTAPVDLLWNGGIGTYVKAKTESNNDAGDKANDALRVNGEQLRCRIVGEGGNLGFTQKGRIEYALNKGNINTDSIDNSAGVDCSDHEVNIKILLSCVLLDGDITPKQRNILLASMTNHVAQLVLYHNDSQNHAITLIESESITDIQGFKHLIHILENKAHLDCALESIPNHQVMQARKILGHGMTRPEISVLLAYTKQFLKTSLLSQSKHIDLTLFKYALLHYFPEQLRTKYVTQIQTHRLAKEIVANQLINPLVNRLGIIFPHRFMQELNCSVAELVNIYHLVCHVFDIENLWSMQSKLEGHISDTTTRHIQLQMRRWIERAMYWFAHNKTQCEVADHYAEQLKEIEKSLSKILPKAEQSQIDNTVNKLIHAGIDALLALKIAQSDILFSCLNAIKVSQKSPASYIEVTRILFQQTSLLNFNWLYQRILMLPKETTWQILSRRTIIDEYNQATCVLLQSVLNEQAKSLNAKLKVWEANHSLAFDRYIALTHSAQIDENIPLEKIVVILGASWNLTHYANK